MHPLTKLIEKGDNPCSIEEIDTIITTYLKGRAEWLSNNPHWIENIDTAFELDEKCEKPCHRCDYPDAKCEHTCKPTLPSKINYEGFLYPDATISYKLNQLIDYLHSKEAR